MAQTIKLKRSSVQNNTPSTSDLELGELAINTHDGKLFIKKDDGTASIVEVGGIVGTSSLTDGSVTTTKIANNAVTAAKLANNSVGIAQLNVSDGTSGQVLTTNGSGTLSFATVSGGSGQANQNAFSNIAVSGQTVVAADSATDTLNLAAGSGINITTNASNDTVTITSTATGSVTEAFKTIAVSGQNNVVADSATDTLTFVAGSNMTITTNDSNDTITFASSGSGASGNTGGIDSQIFNGDGTDTTFTLTTAPTSEDHLWVFVDGVYQNKDSYSISGTTLTMADAPDNGTKLAVHHVRVGTPGTGAITAAMLASPLSLSGDFAVDTNVLKVDASNNRVGINVTTPSHPLDVVGNINVTSGNVQTTDSMILGGSLIHNGDTDTKLQFDTNNIKLIAGGATHFEASSDQTTRIFGGNTAAIVINTSQQVGIGSASPTVSLDVGTKTDAIRVPIGTTGQRPTGAQGLFRYNTTDGQFEGYTDSWGAIAGSGSGSSSNFISQELTGDGTTTAFTLDKTVTSEDNLLVFNEGVFQRKDSYVASGTTITFDTAPASSNKIVVYQMETGVVGVAPVINTMTGDGSDTTLTLSVAPASENQTIVNIDGVTQHKATYSVSGTTLTFSSPPPNNSAVECITLTNMSVTTIGDNDLDTKIHFDETADDDVIRFDTGGTERMVIGGTGKVGIGITNPTGLFDIYHGSSHRLIFTTTGSDNFITSVNGDNSQYADLFINGASTSLGTGGTKRLTINSSGNASFTGDLTVAGDLNITGDINSASVTDLDVTDKTITLGKGQTEGLSGGSGIVIDGSNASMLWDETNGEFDFNNPLSIVNSIGGDTVLNLTGSYGAGNNVALLGFARSGGAVSGDIRYVDATTDMEIGTGTSHGFSIKTAGTRRMRFNNAGRVNLNNGTLFTADGLVIGTINGNCELDLNHSSGKRYRLNNLATGVLQIENKTDGTIPFKIASDDEITIKNNVRIANDGTATAGTVALEVLGTRSDTITPVNATAKFYGYSNGDGLAIGNYLSSPFGSYLQAGYLLDTHGTPYNGGYPITINPKGGNVAIGNEPSPLGKLHVKTADSGGSADTSADELVIEGSGNSGIQLLSGTSNYGTILFGDSGDSAAGRLRYEHNNNLLNFGTNGAWDKLHIKSNGYLVAQSATQVRIVLGNVGNPDNNTSNWVRGNQSYLQYNSAASGHTWEIGGNEKMRIESDGQLQLQSAQTGIHRLDAIYASRFGYSSAYRCLVIGGTGNTVNDNIGIGYNPSGNASGAFTGYGEAVYFRNLVQLRTPNSSNNGFHNVMTFKDGLVVISDTTNAGMSNNSGGARYGHSFGGGQQVNSTNNDTNLILNMSNGTSNPHVLFRYNGGNTGNISTNGSTVSYNTGSDYRLKENVSYDWEATARLKQLKPARFNFIADESDTVLDGFLAHEVSEVVPEAIWGEKDGEDMQQIDQSKLVPLLVKTIQELEARIKVLEDK